MDASASTSGTRSALPVPLDGEIIPPRAKLREAPADAARSAVPPVAKPRLGVVPGGIAVLALLSTGLAGGLYAYQHRGAPDPTALALNRLQKDLGTLKNGVENLQVGSDAARQDDAVHALKRSVDTLKAELDAARASNAAALAQVNAKLDRTDRDPTPKLADIVARLDRLDHDPGPKLTDIATRLDRIERQVSAPMPTGTIASAAKPAVSQPIVQGASAQVLDKPLPRPAVIGNWVVRDVYDGIALVEGRSGGVREVTPGEFLPGAGEVRSIERRGRAWIVVTSRGIIDNSTW